MCVVGVLCEKVVGKQWAWYLKGSAATFQGIALRFRERLENWGYGEGEEETKEEGL